MKPKMKLIKTFAICVLGAAVVVSCGKKQATLPGITQAEVDSVSYAIGLSFGGMLKSSNLESIDFSQVNKGMQDFLSGKKLKIDENKAGQIIQAYIIKAQEATTKIKENAGVQQTEDGLQYKIVKPGNDIKPALTDTVEVNYEGKLLDGTVFDSSYKNGKSVKFPLNGVIRGWSEGLQFIGEGGEMTMWIPFQLGYGPRQMGPNLPGYSTLIFKVELIKVYKDMTSAAAAAPAQVK
jgi:FKBP-type peptidyl-prolyl cis-trans isomerase FklB